MIVSVDVDGVVADLHECWLFRYNEDYGDSLKVEQITEWNMLKFVKPECGTKIFDYLDDPFLYDDVCDIVGAIEGINSLRSAGHRVVFVTTSPINSAMAKYKWLHKMGYFDGVDNPKDDYVECHDKSLVRADVLIDDYHMNLLGFHGKRILFSQPWNKNVTVPGAYIACGWDEIPDMIKDMEND